jgi:hypothetical protein
MQYEVSAEWMWACGRGDTATRFTVVRLRGIVAELDVGERKPWTVIVPWRGRMIVED